MAKTIPSVNGSATSDADAGKAMPVSAPGIRLFDRTLYNREDPNPDFQGRNGVAIYDEMIADPDVDSALSRFTMPFESAEVTIEPGDDTDDAKRQAEWCRKWILCEGHPSDTWAERMEHVAMMFTYGFSAFEKILGPDGEGGQAWVEFCPILPQSIWEFKVDERARFAAMLQRAYFPGDGRDVRPGYREALIPSDKVALFTFRGRGRNYWGRPLIRAAYKPYWHKHNIEILNGIAYERAGVGFMHIKLPDNATQEQVDDAERVVAEGRAHERGGAVTRGAVDIDLKYPTGSPPDYDASIRTYAKQIYSVMMADWEQLGASESGSRAVGGEKIGYALMAYQAVARRIEGVWNLAIRQMTDLKFGSQDKYCSLKFQDLSRMKGNALAQFLAPLMNDNVKAISRDPDIEQHVRKSSQLPPISDRDMKVKRAIYEAALDRELETAKNPPQPPPPPGAPPAGGRPGEPKPGEAPMPKPGEMPKESKPPVEAALPATPFWREPTAVMADGRPHPETFAEFDRMKSMLETEPLKIWTSVVGPQREQMVREAAKRFVAASDADLRKDAVEIPWRDRLTNSLVAPLYDVYLKGRGEVKKELARQGAPVQMQGEVGDEEVTSAQKDWVKTLAGGFVVKMLRQLSEYGSTEALNVRKVDGLSRAEQLARVEGAMRGASVNVAQAALSGTITTAFTTGREEQADAMSDQIETAFYTAMMDDGTKKCTEGGGTCEALDGDQHEPGDTMYSVPNPNCAWMDNCRCVNVYVAKQKEAAA